MSSEDAPENTQYAVPDRCPPSATHFGICLFALAIVLGAMWFLRTFKYHLDEVLVLACAVAIPVVLLDVLVLKVHRRTSTGLDWDQVFKPDFGRVATKLLGLAVTLAPFAVFYWMTPEYNGSFYNPLWGFLRRFALTFAVGVPLYLFIVDGQMKDPYDTYWQLGRVALGRWRDAKAKDVANHYRGWLVKGFFVPIMFVWLNNQTHTTVNFNLENASWSNLSYYDFLYDFIFFIDLLFCTVGYALSLRVTDSHIRTAEPTMLGWAVALFCYPPFYNMFERQYVHYDAGFGFAAFLGAHTTLRWMWAGTILVLITIYVLGTVAFGIRFSNLTHRGILTNGPYRWTKHPAYVSKNMSWWLMSVPFIVKPGASAADSLKHCIGLGIINFMYFMRAKTEERHLSRDPAYVAYALWMNEHGVLRFINRIPFLRRATIYTPPPTAAPVEDVARVIEAGDALYAVKTAERAGAPAPDPAARD